jgi:hypothetical protein
MQFSTAALRASCQMASLRLTASLIRPFSPAGRSVFFRSVESGQLHAGAVSLKACNHWGYWGTTSKVHNYVETNSFYNFTEIAPFR